jgi:hypothetical protein
MLFDLDDIDVLFQSMFSKAIPLLCAGLSVKTVEKIPQFQ